MTTHNLPSGRTCIEKGALFSPCRLYRYSLWRRWDDGPSVAFIGLNPSTADETVDDPTIRRCIGFAKAWGFGGLIMLNLYGFRATKPADMLAAADPVGPENDRAIKRVTGNVEQVVAAWGVNATADRVRQLAQVVKKPLFCLGTTKEGHPRHPLYVPASQPLVEYAAERQQKGAGKG